MTDDKFLLTAANILVFQVLLGHAASLTASHQSLVTLVTLVDIGLATESWFGVGGNSLGLWDSYFHMLLPAILMLVLTLVSARDRSQKDAKKENDFKDMNKLLG